MISNNVGTPELIVEVTSGKTVEKIEFDEFGLQREAEKKSMIPFGFAGGLYDPDTEFVKFGVRDYDPKVGRWITKDPIFFDGGDTNLYGYVAQDP
ncbi:MAG: RHS repeat domain-containing protein [Bdellovibrio sp.]